MERRHTLMHRVALSEAEMLELMEDVELTQRERYADGVYRTMCMLSRGLLDEVFVYVRDGVRVGIRVRGKVAGETW